MSPMRVMITKKFEFSASHRYWKDDWTDEKNEEVFGLCTSPYGHGHNYELHVTVSGTVDPDTGMIINLSDLKKHVKVVLNQFDHKFLNMDTPFFKDQLPTTENVAQVIFDQINQALQGRGEFSLQRIRLYEQPDLYADVWREDI